MRLRLCAFGARRQSTKLVEGELHALVCLLLHLFAEIFMDQCFRKEMEQHNKARVKGPGAGQQLSHHATICWVISNVVLKAGTVCRLWFAVRLFVSHCELD